jgi:ribulose-phosphate 3-epimerase
MKSMLLSASILSSDFTRLGDQIKQCEDAGIDWIHIDVMDGHFVPNITMGPVIVEACRQVTTLPLDVHLMIETPEKFVEDFIQAGASSLTVHPEGNPNIHRTLQHIRTLGCKASIAINPGTSPESIEYLLPLVDMVLVMSVNPGYSGQAFLPESITKVRAVGVLCEKWKVSPDIQVDGGISADTIKLVQQAGANVFVSGNGIFKYPAGVEKAIAQLRSALK